MGASKAIWDLLGRFGASLFGIDFGAFEGLLGPLAGHLSGPKATPKGIKFRAQELSTLQSLLTLLSNFLVSWAGGVARSV